MTKNIKINEICELCIMKVRKKEGKKNTKLRIKKKSIHFFKINYKCFTIINMKNKTNNEHEKRK